MPRSFLPLARRRDSRLILTLATSLTALLLSHPTPAAATEIVPLSIAELGQRSAQVVRGRVADVQSRWNASHTKILTEVRLDVTERFKGSGGDVVRVVELGGTVGNVHMNVAGTVQWKQGEDVLLFLEPSIGPTFHVSGFQQGRFRIDSDPNSTQLFARSESLLNPDLRSTRPDGRYAVDDLLRQALGKDGVTPRRGGER